MSVLKELANRAVTVTVDGQTVELRHPTDEVRLALRKRLDEANAIAKSAEGNIKFTALWNELVADALVATAVDADDMEPADWVRLIVASNEPSSKDNGMLELVQSALRLCTFNVKLTDADGNVIDHVAEVDDNIGDSPIS